MQQIFSDVIGILVDWAWGLPLVLLLMGGGLYLVIVGRAIPLRGFIHAIKLVSGRFHHKGDQTDAGQLSHFKALTNALSATVGLGNIAGVAVAISQGGAGAIFWMWISALVGMNTKFFECTLAVLYRGKDFRGDVQGGPMYVIENALPSKFKFLAMTFAVCGLIGTLSMYQINQLTEYVSLQYQVPRLAVGILSAGLVGYILIGGIQRIANTTVRLVPFMCVFYVLSCVLILSMNFAAIPDLLSRIFIEAWTGKAAFGGAVGIGIKEVIKIGVKRAAFSNEAGVGTAPLAHGNAKTAEPVAEGLVAMLGPFLDTIIICTMTALVILITLPQLGNGEAEGVMMTLRVFEIHLNGLGRHLLGIAVVLFSITTMVGLANYNSKCWDYVFKGRKFFGKPLFIIYYCTAITLGSVTQATDAINVMDIGYALMAWPNMIATLFLAHKVKQEMEIYFAKYITKV